MVTDAYCSYLHKQADTDSSCPDSDSGEPQRPPPSATSSPRRARRTLVCRPAASSRSSLASSRRRARPGASRFEVVEAKNVVMRMVEDFSLLSESDSEDELVESKKVWFIFESLILNGKGCFKFDSRINIPCVMLTRAPRAEKL